MRGPGLESFRTAGRFDLDSNVLDYAGNVHMIDPQLDMTCDLLTIRFTTNGAVEGILARQNVVLTTTNNGRATGATGFYYVTNGSETMQLTTDAVWRNGDEEAMANEFIYDSTRHLLTGIGHVRVRWPNADTNSPGRATNSTGLRAGPMVSANFLPISPPCNFRPPTAWWKAWLPAAMSSSSIKPIKANPQPNKPCTKGRPAVLN
jgi:hypothetical protein